MIKYTKRIILIVVLFALVFLISILSLLPLKYRDIICEMSHKYDLDSSLVASIIRVESNFDKRAKSKVGAIGLMQIMPYTAIWIAQELDIDNFDTILLEDERINIEFGCFYIHYLQTKFMDLDSVLASYNAGETIVRQWLNNTEYSPNGIKLNVIPYKETSGYVQKVNLMQKMYKKLYFLV